MADAYVTSMLGDGEKILAEARQHWMAMIRFALQPILVLLAAFVCLGIGTWLNPTGDGLFNDVFRWIDTLLGLLTAGLFILAVFWLPIQIFRWTKRRYLVTDRRVLYTEGALRHSSTDAGLHMITDVGFRQTFLGQRMGFGDLVIATAANRPLHFRQIRDAVAFKKVIMAAQQGTLVERADQIMGKSDAVPSVAAVATAIDPTNFPPPQPAWDGGDVPQMAEDDVPPPDPLISGTPAVAVAAAEPAVAAAEPAVAAAEPAVAADAVTPAAEPAVAAAQPDDAAAEPAVAAAEPAVAAAEQAVAADAVTPAAEPPVAAAEPAVAAADAFTPAAEPAVAAAADAPTGVEGVTAGLAELADLHDSGAISDAEFETRKQGLLDSL